MSTPTKAQRSIMQRMAKGNDLSVGVYGRVYIRSESGRGTDTVHPATMTVMLREGWITLGTRRYLLTDAGRCVVDAERTAPAGRPGSEAER